MTITHAAPPIFQAPEPLTPGTTIRLRASGEFTSPYTPITWTVGGQPIYPAQGGRGGGGIQFAVGDDSGADPEFDDEQDDEHDEDDDEQDDDERSAGRQRTRRQATDEDGDEDDPDWQPPTREAWERVQGALKRANGEAGKRRRMGKAMEKLGIDDLGTWLTGRGIDPETGEPFGTDVVGTGDEQDEPDDGYEREPAPRETERDARQRDRQTARQILAAEQRGRATARDEVMPILAEYAARTALRDAGFVGTPKQLERALRSIDPATLDLEMDGDSFELIGIDEAIDELRDDLPEYFEQPAARRRTATGATTARAARTATTRTRGGARDVDGGERGRQPKAARSWQDKVAEQMAQRGR